MSKDWQRDVAEWHIKFGAYKHDKPHIPSNEICELRDKLITEEFLELSEAIEYRDLEDISDSIVDLIYVALGTAVSFRIDIQPIWDEVHKCNMAKTGGGKRADGKILKPPGWKKPDIRRLINEQITNS